MADWNDIIITKADKGWAVNIIDAKDYVKEAEYQFNNKDAYKKLQHDSTQAHTRLINDTITRFKNNALQKTLPKGLKYNNKKHQNFTPDQKYIKQ